ncbi:unnamed protein product [Caenorhabditis angaria]|uniref:Uncharacterized protein n=1 Tax=Caenorhabditis angaria TaxID=860376 RepID=A0A9P1MV33_9PELO|nr:unnamed protein product [Caenorhabditis angaria]
MRSTLIFLIFVNILNCSIIVPKIRITCNQENVAFARVFIYEHDENDEDVLPAEKTFSKTNSEGIIETDVLKHINSNHIHLKIRDTCQLENEIENIRCNIPYNEYFVPLRLFHTKDGRNEILLNLADKKYEQYRIIRCL